MAKISENPKTGKLEKSKTTKKKQKPENAKI